MSLRIGWKKIVWDSTYGATLLENYGKCLELPFSPTLGKVKVKEPHLHAVPLFTDVIELICVVTFIQMQFLKYVVCSYMVGTVPTGGRDYGVG